MLGLGLVNWSFTMHCSVKLQCIVKIKTFFISGDLEKSVANNITLVGGGSNKEGNVLLNGKPIW